MIAILFDIHEDENTGTEFSLLKEHSCTLLVFVKSLVYLIILKRTAFLLKLENIFEKKILGLNFIFIFCLFIRCPDLSILKFQSLQIYLSS